MFEASSKANVLVLRFTTILQCFRCPNQRGESDKLAKGLGNINKYKPMAREMLQQEQKL
jgi:hypothetical protein